MKNDTFETPTPQVQFDSSEETRKRIASLIELLHRTSYGFPMDDSDSKPIYIKTLSRLFLECRAKLNPTELKKCQDYVGLLETLQKKWGAALFRPFGVGPHNNNIINVKYREGWQEMMGEAQNFEFLLMDTLDKHGFLMRDKPKNNKPY